MHARAPGLNLTGGAQASARERGGRWRGEADRRGPPVIPNPESRRLASSPATMQGTARSGEGTAGLSGVSPFGWRWWMSPELPGLPATRSCGIGASGVDGSGRLRLQTRRGERGNDQWDAWVPDRGRGGAGEAYTSRTPVSRSGGARARSRARAVIERNWGRMGMFWWCRERVVRRGGLGEAFK